MKSASIWIFALVACVLVRTFVLYDIENTLWVWIGFSFWISAGIGYEIPLIRRNIPWRQHDTR